MEDEDFFQGQLEPEYYPVNEHSLLQYLPMEIKWRIFSFLEPQELSQAMYVCREWAELMNEQSLRNNVFENGFQAVKQAQQIDAAHHRTWMARIANTIPIAHQERQLTPGLRRLRWTCVGGVYCVIFPLCALTFFSSADATFLKTTMILSWKAYLGCNSRSRYSMTGTGLRSQISLTRYLVKSLPWNRQ